MMSENYNKLIEAYKPRGVFFHAVSMICYYELGKDSAIGKEYVKYNNPVYLEKLKAMTQPTRIRDVTECYKHEQSVGVNNDTMHQACREIKDEMLRIPKDNRDMFIKGILSDFAATYKLINPLFTKSYRKINDVIFGDVLFENEIHKKLSKFFADVKNIDPTIISEFVYLAGENYQQFIEFLYTLCNEYNIDLDSLQDDNDLRITPYRSSKPKSTTTTKRKVTTLSSEERAKKIERVVQNLNNLFNVQTKKKFDRLMPDLAEYAINRCKSGKDIYALATFIYECKVVTIVSKPNTITKWIGVFKGACESDLPTDNWKPSKVKAEIKEVMKYFTYLQI